MRVLYAIQTTGNGHLSRAKELIPYFERRFQVDVILSGPKTGMAFDLNPIKHYRGLTLFYTKTGKIDWFKCVFKNNFFRFFRDVIQVPVKKYDLVINDFEPITAWSCKWFDVPCFGLSNQFALWQKNFPQRTSKNAFLLDLLQLLAPVSHGYGFHYHVFSKNIYPPIIKKEIRTLQTTEGGGFLIYLPAYKLAQINQILFHLPTTTVNVFSQEINRAYRIGNHQYNPINASFFGEVLASSDGVITNAGFATTSECLYLKKPLMVVPMKRQPEQMQNALVLGQMGIFVLEEFSTTHLDEIKKWISEPTSFYMPFENNLNKLVDQITLDYIKLKNGIALELKKNNVILPKKVQEPPTEELVS